MTLAKEPYEIQLKRWPAIGRHVLAQFDESTIVVYQAYRPEIGRYAALNQHFGDGFSFNRMSWIKPNFLWMMHRSGWGLKPGQEVTLAIHIRRQAFDKILELAVHSSFVPETYDSPETWKTLLAKSPVRVQWDPDHDPRGAKQERRAIQLGLSGEILRRYAKEWIVKVEDISEFVSEQRIKAQADSFDGLLTPHEEVYPIADPEVAIRLGIDQIGKST